MKAIFISGTDTGIGKTFVSCLLLKNFNKLGYKTFGIKLIASGSHYNQRYSLENDDALLLQETASFYQPYHVVNPIVFKEPVAPHLAALKTGFTLSKKEVKKSILASIQPEVDINIIEGVGGWCIPLNNRELLSDVVAELAIPVVLVVGIKLGCLNHSLLTYHNIRKKRVPFIGWVANCIASDVTLLQENIQTLREWIQEPCLGVVPFNAQEIESSNAEAILRVLF